MRLETERLVLVPCEIDFVEALARDRAEAGLLIAATVPPGWPGHDLAEHLPAYAEGLRDDTRLLGFGVWLVIERAGRVVVGDAGFKGYPSAEGWLEIGYSVLPDHRNAGYATEASAALIGWGLRRDGVRGVMAECDQDNTASIRVLEKLGMERAGLTGRTQRWALTRGP